MTQAFQLVTVVAVGLGLAVYGLLQDRREHRVKKHVDPRQPSIPFPHDQRTEERDLVIR